MVSDLFDRVDEIAGVVDPQAPLRQRAWELRHQFTSYKASYVALAETLAAPLVTATSSSPLPGIGPRFCSLLTPPELPLATVAVKRCCTVSSTSHRGTHGPHTRRAIRGVPDECTRCAGLRGDPAGRASRMFWPSCAGTGRLGLQ